MEIAIEPYLYLRKKPQHTYRHKCWHRNRGKLIGTQHIWLARAHHEEEYHATIGDITVIPIIVKGRGHQLITLWWRKNKRIKSVEEIKRNKRIRNMILKKMYGLKLMIFYGFTSNNKYKLFSRALYEMRNEQNRYAEFVI